MINVTQRWRLLGFLVIIGILSIVYIVFSREGFLDVLSDGAALRQWISQLGLWGPLLIIALLTLAIVMSPIPSAPIALAAGAVYGHYAGTVYVVIGAESGAIVAFLTTRLLGGDILKHRIDSPLLHRFLDSQNALMGIVFISRLLPFISFDMVSYAAGVTPLKFWRFAIATFAGILPVSFLLAHFGSELASSESQSIALTVLLLGLLSLAAMLGEWLTQRNKS